MNPTLAQANAILTCPHVQWEPQARQLIPVIEGLVKELLDAQMDTRRLDFVAALLRNEETEIGYMPGAQRFFVETPESLFHMATLREAIDLAAQHTLVPTPTPATSGTHQPDSVTGDAHSGRALLECPICRGTGYYDSLHGDVVNSVECPQCQQPEPTTTIP